MHDQNPRVVQIRRRIHKALVSLNVQQIEKLSGLLNKLSSFNYIHGFVSFASFVAQGLLSNSDAVANEKIATQTFIKILLSELKTENLLPCCKGRGCSRGLNDEGDNICDNLRVDINADYALIWANLIAYFCNLALDEQDTLNEQAEQQAQQFELQRQIMQCLPELQAYIKELCNSIRLYRMNEAETIDNKAAGTNG